MKVKPDILCVYLKLDQIIIMSLLHLAKPPPPLKTVVVCSGNKSIFVEFVVSLSSLQEHVTHPCYGPNEVHILSFDFFNTGFIVIRLILTRHF
jgi:hypothetical protein